MPRGLRLTLFALTVLGVLFVVAIGTIAHGDGKSPVAVSVRLVDADTGQPLKDAVVSVVAYQEVLDDSDFAERVQESLDYEYNEDPDHGIFFNVSSRHAIGDETMVIHSRALTSGTDVFGITVSSTFLLPDLLVIDHKLHGRTIIEIADNYPVRELEEPYTYSLDLGTIRIPRSR